ncbi:hypothetical protein DM826_07145 [Halonotius aquaticus]|uniref:Streptomycin biosynthesis protein StrF domain-containing protein n=1 Tax=Halonotius aquaticus TaxID=2216978 RepID=A0A3A6PML5_9EURY|nr:glycosyltransferase family A protein [Halonotius aquaticus]RJX43376.1 hypothetical protein DM826_07145 [Halonotius aquaticus]
MSDPVFSVVSVYNDKELLEEWLLDSLEYQSTCEFETVTVDNTKEQFDTAPAALNYGANSADGEYIVFVHQDVRLLTERWFEKAKEYLDDLPDCGIAGVAGKDENGKHKNVIYHGKSPGESQYSLPPKLTDPYKQPKISEHWSEINRDEILQILPEKDLVHPIGNLINSPETAQTLDELLVIIPSSVFEQEQFDSRLCDGWHLYALEYCLRIKYCTEFEVYALPLPVWHYSTGPLDKEFYRILMKITETYQNCTNISQIHATTGDWPMDPQLIEINRRRSILSFIQYGIKNPIHTYKYIKNKFQNSIPAVDK